MVMLVPATCCMTDPCWLGLTFVCPERTARTTSAAIMSRSYRRTEGGGWPQGSLTHLDRSIRDFHPCCSRPWRDQPPAPNLRPPPSVRYPHAPMRWIVRGDFDGFFGLAVDNLVQLLLIDTLCRGVLGFPADLVYGRILPGAAISVLVGNFAYALQARQLAARTGRTDVCALPYGINTVSLFAHVFLIMLPAKMLAVRVGAPDPARVAWQAGLFATLCSGVIELVAAPFAERVRKATPRAALLSTLAGIALSFISLGFLYRTFARPLVGLTTLAVVMLTYFGRVRFKGRLPGGVIAVALGTLIAWLTGIAPVGTSPSGAAIHLPVPIVADLMAAVRGGHLLPYFSVIVAMSLFNVLGSLQNIESAEAAGDPYETRRSLTINGLGSIAAALFGS